MASPQTGDGFIRIANELWDEVIRRNFSKRQKDIIHFIWRFSYGFNRRTAYIPKNVYFELCGVAGNHIKEELIFLETCRVLKWDRDERTFEINKDYDQWSVTPVKGWKQFRFDELIHLNLQKTSQNGNKNLPDSGRKNFPNKEDSDDGEDENFPKREETTSQNGNFFDEKLPKTGSVTPDQVNHDEGSRVSKDILEDSIKDSSTSNNVLSLKSGNDASRNRIEDFSFARIYKLFESDFTEGGKVSQLEAEDLGDQFETYGGEWLLEAMREAVRHKVKTLAYINGILNGYKGRGGPDKERGSPADPSTAPVPGDDDPITIMMREEDRRKLGATTYQPA